MKKQKENILLADCEIEEVREFADALSFCSEPFRIRAHIANWKRNGVFSELKRYGMYFYVSFLYFIKRRHYGMIVGWQQFYALIFCFWCTLFSVKKQNVVMALNFTYKEKKGKLAKLYKWFMNRCVNPQYLDYIHVLSEEYAELIHSQFSFPRERILVTSFGVNDEFEKFIQYPVPQGFEKDGYALAIGRSNRDYDFLVRAWEDIDIPLVIISDTFQSNIDSKNISLLNDAGEASYPWIANCGLMIIPIADGRVCSGDTVLLTAMSVQRKIVVTVPSTLAEMYVIDGENAIVCEKNIDKFSKAVDKVLYSEQYAELGERARMSFLKKFTRKSMGEQLTVKLSGSSGNGTIISEGTVS